MVAKAASTILGSAEKGVKESTLGIRFPRMPVDYKIVLERRLVLTRARGVLTNEEIVGHARRLKLEADFDPTFRQFADLRDVEVSPVTTDAGPWHHEPVLAGCEAGLLCAG